MATKVMTDEETLEKFERERQEESEARLRVRVAQARIDATNRLRNEEAGLAERRADIEIAKEALVILSKLSAQGSQVAEAAASSVTLTVRGEVGQGLAGRLVAAVGALEARLSRQEELVARARVAAEGA